MKVLLLSGGTDSAAIANWKRPDVCVTVDYGQIPAAGEIRASRAICSALGLRHEIIQVDLKSIGSGQMAGGGRLEMSEAPEFWPYRNQMLITVAAMKFLPNGLSEIMIGSVATDTHADGRAQFTAMMDELLMLQEGHVRVSAPGQEYDPIELLHAASFPSDLIGLTFSCHVMSFACGTCRGCIKHREVVNEWLCEVRDRSSKSEVIG